MRVPLLVDTSNVLHTTGVLPPDLAGVDEVGLAALIERSRYRRESTQLVCDGGQPGERQITRSGMVSIRYTGSRSADEVILELVQASSDPRRLLVISSDRQIGAMARRRRAPTLTSDAFLAHLAHDVQAQARRGGSNPAPRRRDGTTLDPRSVDDWLRTFGFDPAARDTDP